MLAALKEIFATIRAGGEIHIAPIFDAPFEFSENRLRLVREYVQNLEDESLAQAEWLENGSEERTLKNGKSIKKKDYCLIIRKAENPIHA